MASLSSILNSNNDQTPWQPVPPEPSPSVDRSVYPSPPAQNPLPIGPEEFDFDSFLQETMDPENQIDFNNVDVEALYDIQDGVRHWADDHAQEENDDSTPQDDSSPQDSGNSSDVEMVDGTEEASPSDDEMADDDTDKVCYGMVSQIHPGHWLYFQ